MRELILKMSMSLDGFVAGSKGEAEWVFGADPEAKDGKPIVAAKACRSSPTCPRQGR